MKDSEIPEYLDDIKTQYLEILNVLKNIDIDDNVILTDTPKSVKDPLTTLKGPSTSLNEVEIKNIVSEKEELLLCDLIKIKIDYLIKNLSVNFFLILVLSIIVVIFIDKTTDLFNKKVKSDDPTKKYYIKKQYYKMFFSWVFILIVLCLICKNMFNSKEETDVIICNKVDVTKKITKDDNKIIKNHMFLI